MLGVVDEKRVGVGIQKAFEAVFGPRVGQVIVRIKIVVYSVVKALFCADTGGDELIDNLRNAVALGESKAYAFPVLALVKVGKNIFVAFAFFEFKSSELDIGVAAREFCVKTECGRIFYNSRFL